MNAIAYDVGTTTLAVRLAHGGRAFSASCENPQRECGGADVLSRVRAAADPARRERMTRELRGALAALTRSLCAEAGLPAGHLTSAAFCGNTVMSYLLAGLDPSPLGCAPFTVSERFGRELPADALGLPLSCPVYAAPCASAFLGGDAVAGAASLPAAPRPALLVDLGTNGELVLLCGGAAFFASAAAGPAFEGAGISCGSAAREGAICAISDGGEPTVIGGGTPRSLCGSGLIDAVAFLRSRGLCSEYGVLTGEGRALERRRSLAPDVSLSGEDLRAFLTAKAAVAAGILTLLHAAGISTADVGTVFLAGSFGAWLSPVSAGRVGLLPEGLAAVARPAGNAALAGALRLALEPDARRGAEALAASGRIVPLAENDFFAREFVARMVL